MVVVVVVVLLLLLPHRSTSRVKGLYATRAHCDKITCVAFARSNSACWFC